MRFKALFLVYVGNYPPTERNTFKTAVNALYWIILISLYCHVCVIIIFNLYNIPYLYRQSKKFLHYVLELKIVV